MRSTCGWRRPISVARPSAAPHIPWRSSPAAAAPRSPPAALISASALPRITMASTTPPGHGVGDGPTAEPSVAVGEPEAAGDGTAGDGGLEADAPGDAEPVVVPHAATNRPTRSATAT